MKKLIIALLLFSTTNVVWAVETEKYAVTQPDGSVAIVQYIPNPTKSLSESLNDLGFTGYPIQALKDSDIPKSRADRNFWKLSGVKVVVDQVKKQADLDAKAAEQAKKDAVLGKLKISRDELKDILK